MQNLDWILLVSRWFHLSAAIVAVGGAFFAWWALHPSIGSSGEPVAGEIREAVRRRWSKVVYLSIAILLLTGGFNFVRLAWPPKVEPMPYHAIFGVKFFAALALFVIASAVNGRSRAFHAMRLQAGKWLKILLILAGLIVLLSGVLNQVRTRPAQPDEQLKVAMIRAEVESSGPMLPRLFPTGRWDRATHRLPGPLTRAAVSVHS